MSDWLESAELPLFGLRSVVMPASLLQSSLDHVQLLCSHVGNNSRVKLLFCLIFLANLHIQVIFCLLPLFAILFCQGTVLFFASGLRTNLSFYNYFMFYTCLHILQTPPTPSLYLSCIFPCRKASFHIQGLLSFSTQTYYRRNTIKLLRRPQQCGWPQGFMEDKWTLSAQFVLRHCEQRARALFLLNEAVVVVILKSLRLNAQYHSTVFALQLLFCFNSSLLNLGQASSEGYHNEETVLKVTCLKKAID